MYIFASFANIPVLEEKHDKGMSFINEIKRSAPELIPGVPQRGLVTNQMHDLLKQRAGLC